MRRIIWSVLCVYVLGLGLVVATGCREEAQSTPAKPTPAPAEPAAQESRVEPAAHPAIDAEYLATARADRDAGVAWLAARQNDDGGWGQPFSMPAFTGLVLKALVQHPAYGPDHPAVTNGYASLLASAQADGGIYDPRVGQANYTTSVAVMALVAAGDGRYAEPIARAVAYLKGIQIVEGSVTPDGTTVGRDHPFFGGVGYGSHGRPDLSNLSFTVDALHEAGVGGDDPFFANAAVFLSRVQNRAESNDQPWAAVVNDGGFVYATAASGADLSGESKADTVTVNGRQGLRSYGSMTYSGFKSLLHANVGRDDPRVRAAREWIGRYWRLDSNPNMPQAQSLQGLYYYYHVFAKALRAWGEPVLTDADGTEHNWRHELIDALHARRQADGHWVNAEPRWYEDNPMLVTAYAVLALQEALK